ncbi:unnamed protein product, partial [Timema podura]|nr:unnamed protein product [Timema podura]
KTIDEHEKTLDINNPRDFIDVYITEQQLQTNSIDSTFSVEGLMAVCLDLFAAGAESVSNTLGFALLYLVLNPQVQEKTHEELDRVVGRNRKVSMEDRQR